MLELKSKDQFNGHRTFLRERPPVIGSEHTESSGEDYADNIKKEYSNLMHAQPEAKPPSLPPKPRIGVGAAGPRGPPPPVQPRSSSLSTSNTSLPQSDDQSNSVVVTENSRISPESKYSTHEAVTTESALLKCDTAQTENLSSPQVEKVSGTDRGFEPEGSVDMSPSYSESGGSVATNNGTPPFVKWKEGFQVLLEDSEGTGLFQKYLEEQQLGHYLTFLIICRGFKKNSETPVEELIKAVYRRFISPKQRRGNLRLECLDAETRSSIESKLHSQDKNIFDGAVEIVTAHLASKFYPNFLTSDVFIEYVRSYQQTETDSRLSAASSVSGSRRQRETQEDSGMEEDRAFSSSKSSTVPVLTMSDSVSVAGQDAQRQSSTSTTCNSSVFNSTTFLPTVDEESELRLNLPAASVESFTASSSSIGYRDPPHKSSSSLNTSCPGPTLTSRSALSRPNEVHPSLLGSSSGTMPDIRSASYAYHANSSNWNPVSRQDSELQSQSSGAIGGDTTDDNYSTFTDVQQQQQQQQQKLKLVKKTHDERSERRKEQQRIEKASKLVREDPNQLLPRPLFGQQKQNQDQPSPDKVEEFARYLTMKLLSVKKERDEEEKLTQKLKLIGDGDSSVASAGPYTTDQSKKKYAAAFAVLGSRNQNELLDAESDQSILDDHVSRIFPGGGTDTPPIRYSRKMNVSANTTGAFDTSRRSMNTSAMSGHSTLPGRSRNPGYPHYASGHNAQTNSLSHHQYHHQFRGATQYPSGHECDVRPNSSASKSLVDMSSGGSHQGGAVPMPPYGGQHKVHNWLKNVSASQQSHQYSMSTLNPSQMHGSDHSLNKTSPRSSGRYHTSARAKSQDRSSGYPGGMYNMSQSFSGQYAPVDPTYLASKLQEQAGRSGAQRSVMSTSTSVLAGSSSQCGSSDVITTVVYRFPQERDEVPYRVKIPKANPTLYDVKCYMPKKGHNFRFYFKTTIDGEACFEQEVNEAAVVPKFGETSIVVQCRND